MVSKVSKAIFMYFKNHGQGRTVARATAEGPLLLMSKVNLWLETSSLCDIQCILYTFWNPISSTHQCWPCRPTSPRWSGILGLWMCSGNGPTCFLSHRLRLYRWYEDDIKTNITMIKGGLARGVQQRLCSKRVGWPEDQRQWRSFLLFRWFKLMKWWNDNIDEITSISKSTFSGDLNWW